MHNKIYVETGVPIPDRVGESLTQASLNDAIKIGINLDAGIDIHQCHFLQFITHLIPDYYGSNLPGYIPKWEEDVPDCMVDPIVPRWKVDTATNSPFYETGGAHIIDVTSAQCCVYDQPGYAIPMPIGKHERIFGCTFVIANNDVIGKVLWSKQHEGTVDHFDSRYMATIKEADRLPDWAVLTARDDAYRTSDSIRSKTYVLPAYLDREVMQSPEEAISEAREDLINFLPPPPDWVLLHDPDFMQLMPRQVLDVGHQIVASELDDHSEIMSENIESVSLTVLQTQRDMAEAMDTLRALQNVSEEKSELIQSDDKKEPSSKSFSSKK